ncbi:MAG: hypothetical protein PHU78_09670 [Heliobacteriaceae bacterium]|nr:hypothetical protein [Heliobacteriaceae bacterium]
MSILLCDSFEDAVITYVVKNWGNGQTNIPLGRTLIQKICYFLKAKGIPLDFKFDIYHYGPYSQELYSRMDELVADGIVIDRSEQKSKSVYKPGENTDELMNQHDISQYIDEIDDIIKLFNQFHPTEMELLATIHYLQTTATKYYGTAPTKNEVVEKVLTVKRDKFSQELISRAYDALKQADLFAWDKNLGS